MVSLKFYIFIFLALLMTAPFSAAEVLRWPQICARGELRVTNSGISTMQAWLQKMNPTLISETELKLAPGSTTVVPLQTSQRTERYSLLHFGSTTDIQASFYCPGKIYPAHSFEGGLLTYRRTDLPQPLINIQNLFTGANKVQLELLDRRQQVLFMFQVDLKSLENKNLSIPSNAPKVWSYFRIQGSARLSVFNLNSAGTEGPWMINPQPVPEVLIYAYFIVGSKGQPSDDQFIVRISDPKMIAKAREQILNPGLEKIVFAKIQKGNGGFNRNWAKKEKSFWSWSASDVTNIADLGSTACNGLPQVVEDRMDFWLKDTGRICFWSYRIKKELKPSEVAAGETVH